MSQLSFLEPNHAPAAGGLFGDLFDDDAPVVADGSYPDGLRWYQREAIQKIDEVHHREGSALLVMATGLGKSRVISTYGKHWDGPRLYVAHRDELVRQLAEELERVTGELVEIEQGDLRCSSRAQLVVASTQTLAQQHRLDRLGRDRFSLVVADEAHHYLSPSYRRLIEYFDAKVLGCTATPDRTDERALAQIFDEVAYCFDILDGIDAGYLVPVRGLEVSLDEIDLSGVDASKSEGGLAQGQLDEVMLKAVEGIVQKTLEFEPHRQAIAFWPGVASAEYAANRFNHFEPGSTGFVSGKTPENERRRIMADFRAGKLKRLSNCQIVTEGVDVPPASLIVMGRPTTSRSLYAQMAGRGTRVLPGTVDHIHGRGAAEARREAIRSSSKPDCVILDCVGNAGKHSLVSPLDLLGGNFTEAEIKIAKRKMAPGGDVRSALEDARRELRDLARLERGKVSATVRAFDPFAILDIDPVDEDRYTRRFGFKPLTPAQHYRLMKMKVPKEWLKDCSKRQASKLISEAISRSDKGLCTFAQLQQLKQHGIQDANISYERAGAAMTYLASKGWGKKGKIDPHALWAILKHQRQPGEEG